MENKMNNEKEIVSFLERIAIALENITNKNRVKKISISDESCYLWSTERMNLLPIKNINNIGINLLHAIDNVKEVLINREYTPEEER